VFKAYLIDEGLFAEYMKALLKGAKASFSFKFLMRFKNGDLGKSKK
jgi:hypothetical protein